MSGAGAGIDLKRKIILEFQRRAQIIAQKEEHAPILTLLKDGQAEMSVVMVQADPGVFGEALRSILSGQSADAYVLVVEARTRAEREEDRRDLLLMTYCQNGQVPEQWICPVEGQVPRRWTGDWEGTKTTGPSTITQW